MECKQIAIYKVPNTVCSQPDDELPVHSVLCTNCTWRSNNMPTCIFLLLWLMYMNV